MVVYFRLHCLQMSSLRSEFTRELFIDLEKLELWLGMHIISIITGRSGCIKLVKSDFSNPLEITIMSIIYTQTALNS